MAAGARQLLAGSAAVTVAAASALALAGVRHACAERALLTSAPTRQIIVADARLPADLHRYAAAITDAPVDPALLNRWIAASPSATDRAAGFALLRRMGFRDTGAQLDIMADSLSRGDLATFAARIDALFAQQVGTAAVAGVLSVMERDPRLQRFVVDRLSTRPVWRARYLFDPAALIDPAGRQARLATLRALGAGDDLRAAFAFASREGWKHRDVAAAEAFWRAGSAGAAASSDAHFPFEWQLGSTADFEGSLIRRGDLLSVRVDWNGHGTAPFVSRRIAGPIESNAALAEITAARGDLDRIDVVYRCQGSGWRNASPVTTRGGAAFRAGEALDCPAGEIGIVPADEPGRETTLRFRLPVARPNESVAR